MNAQAQARKAAANPNKADNSTTANATTMSMSSIANNTNSIDTNAIKTEITATSADDFLQQIQQQQQQQQVLQLQGDCQTICLHVNIQTKSELNVYEMKWINCCCCFSAKNPISGTNKWQYNRAGANQITTIIDHKLSRWYNKHCGAASIVECNFIGQPK